MMKTPKNGHKRWTKQDIAELKNLAKGNTPTRVIALKLDRSEAAVQAKAFRERISLEPPNQSPYGPRKTKK